MKNSLIKIRTFKSKKTSLLLPKLFNLKGLLIFLLIFEFQPSYAQWAELSGLNSLNAIGQINTVCADNQGNVYAAGHFSIDNIQSSVAKWNGTRWDALGNLSGNVYSLCMDASGNVYASGNVLNSLAKNYVAKWNGSAWNELGGLNALAANNQILSICSDASGNIYAGGDFTNASGKRYVALYNGNTWSELGGLNSLSANNTIYSIASDQAGNIFSGGQFTNASNYHYIAKWNGTTWNELGGTNAIGPGANILSICTDPTGNVYASEGTNNSAFEYVYKWNGSYWGALGGLYALNANAAIYAICSDALGNIYAAGEFSNSLVYTSGNRYVAKWNINTSTWSELGGTNSLGVQNTIRSICNDASGNIYATGQFVNSNGKNFISRYSTNAVSVSISITSGNNPTCAGSLTTFTAVPTNGGANPSYQWKVDGINVGTNSPTYSSSSLTQGQLVSCTLTSNLAGAFGNPATSNGINIIVSIPTAAAVSITASKTTVCAGEQVTFTAAPTNEGSAPSYQWKINGANAGTNSASFAASIFSNGQVISCDLTSNSTCASVLTASSNSISVVVNASLASVNITADKNNICPGTPINFTATVANGGPSPTINWNLNGNYTSATGNIWNAQFLKNQQVVSCVVTPNSTCTTKTISNFIVVSVQQLEPEISIMTSSTNICQGSNVTFTANAINPGISPNYTWKVDGIPVGGSNQFTSNSLTNGQIVSCDISSTSYNCIMEASPDGTSGTVNQSAVLGEPYCTLKSNGRQQYLVRASELTSSGLSAGQLTSLSFYLAGAQGNPPYLLNYSIKLAQTSATNLDNGFLNPVFTSVFSNAFTPHINTINTHNFSTYFFWDGVSNVLVDICFDNLSNGSSTFRAYQYLNKPYNCLAEGSNTNTSICTQLATTIYHQRPLMTFRGNPSKTATSNKITMSVYPASPSSISISNIEPTSICKGGTVSLVSSLTGNYNYQWKLNGQNIAGANASNYVAKQAGNYTCSVSSSCPTITSNTISITSNTQTASITAIGATTFCNGGNVILNANAASGQSYQWKKNGIVITGATFASYNASSTGNYTCIVSGTCGSATSNSISVISGIPSQPAAISGVQAVCVNSIQGYSIVNVPTASSYLWTVPAAAAITSGQGTNSISVHYGHASGNISCAAINTCGTGISKILPITIACRTIGESEIGLSKTNTNEIHVFPNPSEDGIFTIAFENVNVQKLSVYDLLGAKVFEDDQVNSVGDYTLKLAELAKGVYVLKVQGRELSQVLLIRK